MRKSNKLALAMVCSMTVAPFASAATTFDFTGLTSGSSASYSDTRDGIGLTATGFRKDVFFCQLFGSAEVTTASDGLGVVADSGACLGNYDSAELDGQINEVLQFSFDQDIRMISIAFNSIDGDDPYNVFADTGSGFTQISGGASDNPYTFSPFLTGDGLRIGATDNASAFRVTGITVAAVPLPAAGFLLLGALGGLGFAARRRQKS